MREKYYKLIKDNNINDTLSLITEIPFSTKTRILNRLIKKHSILEINMALNDFKKMYEINKPNLNFLEKTLEGLCRVNKGS